MSLYTSIYIDGPRAGAYHSSGLNRVAVEGFQYEHRVLVRFKDGQTIGAWVPEQMTNIIALQKVFDVYVAVNAK